MIVLLSRDPDIDVDPSLALLGPIQVSRAPTQPRPSDGRPRSWIWADKALADLTATVESGDVTAVVCADEGSQPFAWCVAERFPALPVIAGQETAMRILQTLSERGLPATTENVRSLLDRDRLPWPDAPDYFVDPAVRPPLVVSLVNNTVDVDSRVQKVARSLSQVGYDSVLVGRSPRNEPHGDYLIQDSAVVLRPAVATHRLDRQRETPPPSAMSGLLGAPHRQSPGRIARRLDAYRERLSDRDRQEFLSGSPSSRSLRRRARRIQEGEESARSAFPAVSDYADAFTPIVVQLRPDIIHVHDPTLIPTAIEARRVLNRAGHRTKIVFDAHEWTLGIKRDHALQVAALARLESEHMSDMDAVITVSDPIADRMVEHFHLADRPAVVTNSPVATDKTATSDVRSDCGLPPQTPLLVYTGTILQTRGVDLALKALVQLPDTHLALISRRSKTTKEILESARELGIADRVHRLDYVPADVVPAYLKTADIGIIPFRPHGNSDLGIPTKFREYILAGLPIVATDIGMSGAEVTRTGIGEVCAPNAPDEMVRAVRTVLADPSRYRARITEDMRRANSWQSQESVLAALYERVTPKPPVPIEAPTGVLIGGVNSAGQGYAWARALRARGVDAKSLELRLPENPFEYPADVVIARRSAETLQRQVQLMFRELLSAQSIILESGRVIAAPEPGTPPARRRGFREAQALADSGRNVGLIFHGSELRRPDLHARTHRWSPFPDPGFAEVTNELRTRARVIHEQLASWEGPVMVSTPDLVGQNPAARWVPVVIDVDRFAAPERRPPHGVPVVLHLPSKSMLKGSRYIDPVLQELADAGVIRYRRLTNVPHHRVPELLRESDIFVDQLGMGIMGVAAVEAMASGIPVVTDPGPEALVAYGEDVPLVSADPTTIAQAITDLAADPETWQQLSAAGPEFARRHHDGRRSARSIIDAMGLSSPGTD